MGSALGQHLFWTVSRAAGMALLVLSSASVGLGLAMGGRLARGATHDLRPAHEALSLATLAALLVHAGSLLGDAFLHPRLLDITVPLAFGFQRLWTSTGIVAGWLMLGLGLSFYARGRIGVARWRLLHRFTALAWLLGLVHAVNEGTDAGEFWFLVPAAMVVLPALGLLLARLAPALRRPPAAPVS